MQKNGPKDVKETQDLGETDWSDAPWDNSQIKGTE